MMKTKKINMGIYVEPDQWNIVSEVGLPKDATLCFVLFGENLEKLSWTVSLYDESNHNFYVNYGYGGLILEETEVFAWCKVTDEQLRSVKDK